MRIFAVVALLFVLWFLNAHFQPFHGDGSGRVAVTIPKGASVSEIGDILGEKGVIDSSTFFQIRARLEGKSSGLYSGRFTLAHGMSYSAALDALSTPPVKRTLTVTIPEGYSRPQTAQLVEEDGVPGSYTKATIKSKYLNPAKYGGKGAKNLEGFLFPDTFELKPNTPVGDLVQLQLQDFKRRIKGVNMRYAKSKNLTIYDVLIIASMIEREVAAPSQRKLVASVIYNRLHEGMPLGIDSTIRFATGNYTKPLTESELATDSPYNTRTNAGLPPGPIDSPGQEAIEAAAHPAKTGYLFYVTTPGACGKLTFAKTEAEFEAAVNKYNSAREAAGGNSPTSCGE
ncbi:MAG: endolytic transglycosylase MltG [Solirubrobacterales bacterium]